MERTDPLRNFRVRLEIDNITQAGFSEVAIGETTVDPVEYAKVATPVVPTYSRGFVVLAKSVLGGLRHEYSDPPMVA